MVVRFHFAEHIQVACQICGSALLLGGAPFAAAHAGGLARMLAGALGTLNERGALLLLPLINLALSAFPEDMPAALEPALGRLLALLLAGREGGQVVAGAFPLCYCRAGRPPSLMHLRLSSVAELCHPNGCNWGVSSVTSKGPAWLRNLPHLTLLMAEATSGVVALVTASHCTGAPF